MAGGVLSLEAFWDKQAEADFRTQVHRAVDEMLDCLEVHLSDSGSPLPRLHELTEAVRQDRAGLTATIVKSSVERVDGN